MFEQICSVSAKILFHIA